MENIEEYKKMTIEHDKHIDALTSSISHLVTSVSSTNKKLDDVVEVISQQNVLVERMNNLDNNLKESFDRIHDTTRTLQNTQRVGCGPLQTEHEIVKSLGRSVDTLRATISTTNTNIETLDNKVDKKADTSTIIWIIVIAFGYIVSFGTYVVTTTHNLETSTASHETSHKLSKAQIIDRLNKLESKAHNDK